MTPHLFWLLSIFAPWLLAGIDGADHVQVVRLHEAHRGAL